MCRPEGHETEQNVCLEGGAGETVMIAGVVYVGVGEEQASYMEETASPQPRHGDEAECSLWRA